jgi:cobalt-zinc-cadmium resistance protein CzcA
MFRRLTSVVVERPMIAVIVGLAIAIAGAWSFWDLPHVLYPDISPTEVLIISTYPGRSPQDIERQVTIPLELAMGGVPYIRTVRSRTIFGLSVVDLTFEPGTDKYFARQLVEEGLAATDLPAGVKPQLGPLATSSGEIYRYELVSDGTRDLVELRTLNDWVVIPRLKKAAGVAEVVNFGGYVKQYTLNFDAQRLERFGFTLDDVIRSVRENNATAGGGVLRRGDMAFVIQGRGLLTSESEIESTVINTVGGIPVHVHDVASVQVDAKVPTGWFGKDETSQSVEGIVLLSKGEKPSLALHDIDSEVANLNENILPSGVRVVPFYNRQALVHSSLMTVGHNVRTGIGLVLLTLLALVGNPRAAVLGGLAIPFSLLAAAPLLRLAGIPVSLLSMGAIDIGILAASALVVGEYIGSRLSISGHGPPELNARPTIMDAAAEIQRPVLLCLATLACTYLPLITLRDIEGRLFRPVALTIIFTLAGAALFALLIVPALLSFWVRRDFTVVENPVMRLLRPVYAACLRVLLFFRWPVLGATLAGSAAVIWFVMPRLDFDFLPELGEGVIWVRADFPEGMSIDQTAEFADSLRSIARGLPDLAFVTSQVGRNDTGTDAFPPSRVEMMIGLQPGAGWITTARQDLVGDLEARLRNEFPTVRFSFTQPMIDGVTEDTNGTSADLAVEISGPDLRVLHDLGRKTAEVLAQVPGAVDVNLDQEGPQPQLLIRPDRGRCAQYGVKIDDVNQLINTALGGEPIATFYEGEQRFDIVARFDVASSRSLEAIGNLPVYTDRGISLPLSQVADFSLTDGPTVIARSDGHRCVAVRGDIAGPARARFVADAQRRFAEAVEVPQGYSVRWIGMFENLERVNQHILISFPATILFMFVLLLATFGTWRDAFLALLTLPFPLICGALALYAQQMTVTVSSGIVVRALCGVFLLDVVLLIKTLGDCDHGEHGPNGAIVDGALRRFRPTLITTSVAVLAALPAAVSHGLGSDAQGPQARVIIWGLLMSLPLKLFVVPVLYRIVAAKRHLPTAVS